MNLTYILIDFENVKPAAADLKLIRGTNYRVQIFHGPHQNKFDADTVKALQPLGGQVEFIQSAQSGKNALDFHISFYLGRLIPELDGTVSATQKLARFFVVSKDTGFDVLLAHVRELGYSAARMATVREALSVDGSAVVLNPPADTKLSKKAAARKPSPEKRPALKAKPVEQKATPSTSPQSKKGTAWSRTIESLRDHPNNRPTSNKALERHVTALLGKDTSPEALKDVIARLQREGIVRAVGKNIEVQDPERVRR
jgi:hypothetical protein